MKLAITSESYRRAISSGKIDLFQFLELVARELKLSAVELEHRDFQSADLAYLQQVKSKLVACQLEVINIGLSNDYGKATKEEREKEFEKFKQWLAVPKILGVPSMRIFAAQSSDPKFWDEAMNYVRKSCLLARKEGITLLIEPENYGFPRDAATTLKLFQKVNQDNLKLLLDTGNYTDGIVSIKKTLHLAALIHTKFLKVDKEGNESDIDYDAIFDLLKKRGYNGPISVEYEGEEDEFTAVPRVISRIKRYLAAH